MIVKLLPKSSKAYRKAVPMAIPRKQLPGGCPNHPWPVLVADIEGLALPLYVLAAIFGMVAFFYASVGLGGGSSYTALLTILGAGVAVIPMASLFLF